MTDLATEINRARMIRLYQAYPAEVRKAMAKCKVFDLRTANNEELEKVERSL